MNFKTSTLLTILSVFVLILVNFFTSFILVNSGFTITKNYFPVGFGFGLIASILIFILGGFFIYKLRLIQQFPLITTLIIAGAISNFLEFSLYGFVVDYINIGIAVLNLADLQIYWGLLLLNWRLLSK